MTDMVAEIADSNSTHAEQPRREMPPLQKNDG